MSRIILGDAIEWMSKLPEKSVDFICVDLPYGVTSNKKDIIIPFEDLWRQFKRIRKGHTTIALFGQGLFFIDLVNSNRKEFRYDLVWDKVLTSGFLDAKNKPLRRHEQIAIFQEFPRKTIYNPQFTQGIPLHSKGKSYLDKEHKNENYGSFEMTDDSRAGSTDKYPTSIIRFQKPHPSKAIHRTEKSIECLEWLIKTYSNEEQTVLDCCAGSFTLGVAAENTKREFTLIEKDEIEFNKGKERLYGNTTTKNSIR
jgi:site-specific DNA-methyltransferase (adenine-specific)